MNESTVRPVSSSTPLIRSSRMVAWNSRRMVSSSSFSSTSSRWRSPLVMVSCVMHTTKLSRMPVRAFVGARPVYSENRRTTCLLIAADNDGSGVASWVQVISGSFPGPELRRVGLEKAMLLHKPARAAARDQLRVAFLGECEEDRQLGMGTRQQAAELKPVVVAKAYV